MRPPITTNSSGTKTHLLLGDIDRAVWGSILSNPSRPHRAGRGHCPHSVPAVGTTPGPRCRSSPGLCGSLLLASVLPGSFDPSRLHWPKTNRPIRGENRHFTTVNQTTRSRWHAPAQPASRPSGLSNYRTPDGAVWFGAQTDLGGKRGGLSCLGSES